MSSTFKDYLTSYVWLLIGAMRVPIREIKIEYDPKGEGYIAKIVVTYDRIVLTVSKAFLRESAEEKRATIGHELFHFFTEHTHDRIMAVIERSAKAQTIPGISNLIDHELDLLTETAAQLFASTLPAWEFSE